MASPVKLYQQEMHENLGFFATWLPGDPVEVGDAGVIQGGRFRKMASLEELGIEYRVSGEGAMHDVQYASSQGTKITMSAGAEVGSLAKAEIQVEFSRSGAFVFHATALRQQSIENRTSVAEQIVRAFEQKRWKKEWLLIEALHTADRATIIVSEDSSAGLVLVASADAPLPGISLADPKAALTVASMRGRIVHILGSEGLRPLYSCLRLKNPLFRSPSLQPVRGGTPHSEEVPLSRPGIDELLNS